MLDIKWIRENPDALDRALAHRGWEPDAGLLSKLRDGWPTEVESIETAPTPEEKRRRVIDALVGIDKERRLLIEQVEASRQLRNTKSKEIGRAKATGDEAVVQRLLAEVAEYKKLEQQPEEIAERLDQALAYIPNVPLDDVPVGPDEHANVECRRWGEKPNRWGNAFKPKEHYELGEALGQMDFETAAKLSGSRFVVLKKGLARLERALGQFMLDLHTEEHGYTEVQPPLLVRDEVLFGTGKLPKFGRTCSSQHLLSSSASGRFVRNEIEAFLR